MLAATWSGCGGTTVEGASAGGAADAPTADASLATDGSTSDDAEPATDAGSEAALVDAGSTELCAGDAKARWQGQQVQPVPVTSGPIVMDCCDGFTVRWHTSSVFGFDAVFALRTGGMMSPGSFDLAADAGAFVSVSKPGEYFQEGQSLEGLATIQHPGGTDAPAHLSVCVTVRTPGDALDGLQLYVPDVPLMSWAQQDDWTLSLLSDPTLTAVEASSLPLDSLPLAPPLAMLWQVAFYDASEHKIVWDSWGNTSMIINQLPAVGVEGVPFVVSAAGEPVFLGAFMTLVSSTVFGGPTVLLETVKDEELVFEAGYPGGASPDPDPRSDPRILEALAGAGKLVAE